MVDRVVKVFNEKLLTNEADTLSILKNLVTFLFKLGSHGVLDMGTFIQDMQALTVSHPDSH